MREQNQVSRLTQGLVVVVVKHCPFAWFFSFEGIDQVDLDETFHVCTHQHPALL
jgi:hypothetical protein